MDENGGELVGGVIRGKVWAIEQSRHLSRELSTKTEKERERASVLSEMDEELEVAREVGGFCPALGRDFFGSKPLCSESPRTRET